MATFFKIADTPDANEADEKCCKQGKFIFTNNDGKEGEGSDSYTFTAIFARYSNPVHTFMFKLPLDTWAFYQEHGMHPLAYAH